MSWRATLEFTEYTSEVFFIKSFLFFLNSLAWRVFFVLSLYVGDIIVSAIIKETNVDNKSIRDMQRRRIRISF